jgi:ribosome-associated translation inhibitor RaiA
MTFPLRIHLLDMGPSVAIEAKIRERAMKLERFSSIERCEVWVESPRGHHRAGPLFGVRIRLSIAGDDVAVELQPTEDDVFVAIRQAFDAARRRLEDAGRRRNGRVKAHPRAPGDPSALRRVPSRASTSPARKKAGRKIVA